MFFSCKSYSSIKDNIIISTVSLSSTKIYVYKNFPAEVGYVTKSSLLLFVRGGLIIDHNISVIVHYFLITSRVHLVMKRSLRCRQLSAILPIVKSCSV